jgi:undecaprenyl diphosphate synthase
MVADRPDLLIRTSNEVRLSNFLLMQVQQGTQILFEKKNWP